MSLAKKSVAEFLGTFWLVLGGCGSAVLAAGVPEVGIGYLGVSLAFGLTVLTMAFAIGHISGCHLNPAVSVGLAVCGRFNWSELPAYVVSQVLGAIVAAAVLAWIAEVAPDAHIIRTQYAQVPLDLILDNGRTGPAQTASFGQIAAGIDADGHAFESWTFRAEQPLSGERLLAVMNGLPASIYRAKGIVYMAGDPGRRYVLHLTGKRVTLIADRRWAEIEPGTQLVFIGAAGALDTVDLNAKLSDCTAA